MKHSKSRFIGILGTGQAGQAKSAPVRLETAPTGGECRFISLIHHKYSTPNVNRLDLRRLFVLR